MSNIITKETIKMNKIAYMFWDFADEKFNIEMFVDRELYLISEKNMQDTCDYISLIIGRSGTIFVENLGMGIYLQEAFENYGFTVVGIKGKRIKLRPNGILIK